MVVVSTSAAYWRPDPAMGFEICMVGMRDCCCCCCVVFRFLAMRQQKIIPERITATPTPAPMPAFAPTERPPESESESEPESESAEFEEEAVVEPVPDPVACAAAEVPVVDEDVTCVSQRDGTGSSGSRGYSRHCPWPCLGSRSATLMRQN